MNRKRIIALLMLAFYLLQLGIIVFWHSLAQDNARTTDAFVSIAIAILVGIVDYSIVRYLLSTLSKLQASYGYDVAKRLERSLAGYHEESLREETIARNLGISIAQELEKACDALARGDIAEVSSLLHTSLDIASSAPTFPCENLAVAAVLASKTRQCAEEGVSLVARVMLPEPLPLPDIDVAAIFFNLIDNALNECRSLVTEGLVSDPQIDVFSRIQAGQLFVKVENPSHQGVDTTIKAIERRSTTSSQHGWGTDIVSSIAHDQDGMAKFEESGGRFVAKVMIPLARGVATRG